MQILETDSKEDTIVLEPYLEFFAHEPVFSAVSGLRTSQGREILKDLAQQWEGRRNAPLLVAWDREKKKVYKTCDTN